MTESKHVTDLKPVFSNEERGYSAGDGGTLFVFQGYLLNKHLLQVPHTTQIWHQSGQYYDECIYAVGRTKMKKAMYCSWFPWEISSVTNKS